MGGGTAYRCSGVVAALAALALGYAIACAVYLLLVRLSGVGTPFLDSLTPAQRGVLEASKGKRRTAFLVGALVAAVVLCAARPFR